LSAVADDPDPGGGRPGPLERRLMRRYGRGTLGRMKVAAGFRALSVLLRRHPRAALDMAGSGLVHAGRVGVRDLTRRLRRYDRSGARPPARLTRREARAFQRLLDRAAESELET
jgi:hypothetical protein